MARPWKPQTCGAGRPWWWVPWGPRVPAGSEVYSISCGVMRDFARRLAALGATIRMEHERAECCHGGLYYGLGRTGEGAQEKAPLKAGPSARARPARGGPLGRTEAGPGSPMRAAVSCGNCQPPEEARGAQAGDKKNPPPGPNAPAGSETAAQAGTACPEPIWRSGDGGKSQRSPPQTGRAKEAGGGAQAPGRDPADSTQGIAPEEATVEAAYHSCRGGGASCGPDHFLQGPECGGHWQREVHCRDGDCCFRHRNRGESADLWQVPGCGQNFGRASLCGSGADWYKTSEYGQY